MSDENLDDNLEGTAVAYGGAKSAYSEPPYTLESDSSQSDDGAASETADNLKRQQGLSDDDKSVKGPLSNRPITIPETPARTKTQMQRSIPGDRPPIGLVFHNLIHSSVNIENINISYVSEEHPGYKVENVNKKQVKASAPPEDEKELSDVSGLQTNNDQPHTVISGKSSIPSKTARTLEPRVTVQAKNSDICDETTVENQQQLERAAFLKAEDKNDDPWELEIASSQQNTNTPSPSICERILGIARQGCRCCCRKDETNSEDVGNRVTFRAQTEDRDEHQGLLAPDNSIEKDAETKQQLMTSSALPPVPALRELENGEHCNVSEYRNEGMQKNEVEASESGESDHSGGSRVEGTAHQESSHRNVPQAASSSLATLEDRHLHLNPGSSGQGATVLQERSHGNVQLGASPDLVISELKDHRLNSGSNRIQNLSHVSGKEQAASRTPEQAPIGEAETLDANRPTEARQVLGDASLITGQADSAISFSQVYSEIKALKLKVDELFKNQSDKSDRQLELLTLEVNKLSGTVLSLSHRSDEEKQNFNALKQEIERLQFAVQAWEYRGNGTASVKSRPSVDDVVELTDTIKYFKSRKLHRKSSMALIYKGEKATAGAPIPIVVKLVPYTEEALREASSLHSADSHPNVVRVYDSGRYKSELTEYVFVAMEQCSTVNLLQYLNNNSLNQQQALEYCTKIISGIDHIHKLNIAHRDIKPENVLFKVDAGYEQLKIVDFGTSKNMDEVFQSSRAIGTAGYIAPEIVNSVKHKKRDFQKCDIFSTGILLGSVLSNGKHLYGEEQCEWNYNVGKGNSPNFTEIQLSNGARRDDIICLLKEMLQHDPINRCLTAAELFRKWKEVLALPDPIVEIEKELKENMSTPLSEVKFVESKAKSIDIMGCKVEFAENTFPWTALVYVGVKPKAYHVPKQQFAISPEFECRIFNSSCRHKVNISLPIYALPNSDGLTVSGRYQVHGSPDWKDIEKPSLTVKDRNVEFKIPPFSCAKLLITCSKIEAVYAGHLLYFSSEQLGSVVCLDNEALANRCIDIFKREKFELASGLSSEPIVIKDGEELKYQYMYASPNTGTSFLPGKEIVVKEDKLVQTSIHCESIFTNFLQKEGLQKALEVEMFLLSVPIRKEKLIMTTEGNDVSTEVVYSVPYMNVRRSTEKFYRESFSKDGNYPVSHDRPKGMVLIVNNEMVVHSYRLGSRVDMTNQVALWKDLGFYVLPKTNLTAEDMRGTCENFATIVGRKCPSIVIIVIMTHGWSQNGRLMLKGEDCSDIPLQDIMSFFTNENLKKRIPKLFIVQACRMEKEQQKNPESGIPKPDQPDTIIAYSSVTGQGSTRNQLYGSRAMNAIAKVFMQHSHNRDVLGMFTKVNKEVSKMGSKVRQISVQKSAMLEDLFLFPGWPTEK